MLRLLFCTAAILPIGIIPWMMTKSGQVDAPVQQETYAELVTDPNIEALEDCDAGDLPVFFHDGVVTTHSAEFIADGLEAADGCGDLDVTIMPVLPEDAVPQDIADSVQRTEELVQYVEAAANVSDVDIELDVTEKVIEDDITTLYINGRAAILHIEPSGDAE